MPLWFGLAIFALAFVLYISVSGSRLFVAFLVATDIFIFCFGNLLTAYQGPPYHYLRHVPGTGPVRLTGTVSDLPVKKTNTVRLMVELEGLLLNDTLKPVCGQIIVYLRPGTGDKVPSAGDHLLLSGRLTQPQSPLNPAEFNYRQYLFNRHIHHTLFADSTDFSLLSGPGRINRLWKFGLDCKQFVLKKLEISSLIDEAKGICAALLTGYDDEIDREVINAFAHSGTLHVLSVSGLHTGLIYLLLNGLFNILDRKKRWKVARFVLITVFLWFFALVAGFSPPVLRAVIMFNLLGLGRLFFRHSSHHMINLLLVSAFILLVSDPWLITDVGFLLSYFAMFGLLYFQPGLVGLWEPKGYLARSLWISVSASLSATLSTLPITLLVFKQFPLWFFVCNIVVVPATFAILLIGVGVVLQWQFCTIVINWLVKFLLWFIAIFDHAGWGYFERIDFGPVDAVFLFLLIWLLSLAFSQKRYRWLQLSFLCLIGWQLVALVTGFRTKSNEGLTVFAFKNASGMLVKSKNLVIVDPMPEKNFSFTVNPYLSTLNYPNLRQSRFNHIKSGSFEMLILDSADCWPLAELSGTCVLLLRRNFVPVEAELRSMKKLRLIVCDGSCSGFAQRRVSELSRKLGLQFHSTMTGGAYCKTFQ